MDCLADVEGTNDYDSHLGAAGLYVLSRLGSGRSKAISISDTTNKKNLLLLIQLRWIAVVGQVATILVVHFAMGVSLPLREMGAVILFLIGLNMVSLIRLRRQQHVSNTELFLELLLDVAALTVQLYLSGGASNPFISLFLLQVTIGAILLEAWSVGTLIALTTACFMGLTIYYRKLDLPHDHDGGLFNLHIQGMLACFVLAACLLALFINRITRNLRERDARLAELRQRAAEEDHIVRMGLLASGAAHELGTPLSTLSVILGDWRRMKPISADPVLMREVGVMQGQVERCKTIVSGILMSSGEARGEGTVRTSVQAFFDSVANEWRQATHPENFVYENCFEADGPMVSDLALKQVLFNVLDNALDASPSFVRMKVGQRASDCIVTVDDKGPGFTPDVLSQIGKPYTSTKARPGAGLGLFLVINVIRKLGGSASALNKPEGGASVELILPLSPEQEHAHG